MFLFSDTQIKDESFVEDINNLLNSGEVPNMFAQDERMGMLEAVRPAAARRYVTSRCFTCRPPGLPILCV